MKRKKRLGKNLIIFSYIITLLSILVLVLKLFYPRHIFIAISLYLSNWIVFIIGGSILGKNYYSKIKHYRKIILFSITVLLLIYLIYVFLPIGKVEFLGMSKVELSEKIDEDFQRLIIATEGLNRTVEEFQGKNSIFNKTSLDELNQTEKQALLDFWSDYLAYQSELNILIDDYKYFYQINYYLNKELHSKAFLIGYASFVSSYSSSSELINKTINNPLFEILLDDSNEQLGIPAGEYTELRYNVLHINDVLRLEAGHQNYLFLKKQYEKLDLISKHPSLFSEIEYNYDKSNNFLKKNSVVWFPSEGIYRAKEKVYYYAWFPVQKKTAETIGNIRLTTRHESFITSKQVDEMKKSLEPGDILVTRKERYLSNAGIPGFWPHAAIYIGDIQTFLKYFNTTEIQEFVKQKGYSNLDELLQKEYGVFYSDFLKKGEVIEALGDGVILNSLETTANADSIGAVRPEISKLNKLKSLLIAYTHYKKEYDFHFDFITDSKIVCSELIYKSYREQINLSLIDHSGRQIFPANRIIEKLDEGYGNKDSELVFVYFLDGDINKEISIKKDVEKLRISWKRPRWN